MSERNKKQCIVLLPSGPHFERLFDEILRPAIDEIGLAPSRLPQNHSVSDSNQHLRRRDRAGRSPLGRCIGGHS